MTKNENIADPNSCWNKALPDEQVFVLLGHDPDMPGTLRDWARRRRLRLQNPADLKAQSAVQLAERLEREGVTPPTLAQRPTSE